MNLYRVLWYKCTTGTKVRVNVRAPDPYWAVLLTGEEMGFEMTEKGTIINVGDWVPIYSKRLVKSPLVSGPRCRGPR